MAFSPQQWPRQTLYGDVRALIEKAIGGNAVLAPPTQPYSINDAVVSRPSPVPPESPLSPQQQSNMIFVFDPTRFFDAQTIAVPFVGAGDILVLPRSGARRVFLSIQSNLIGANCTIAYDRAATATTGRVLYPGQTVTYDESVPQNDLHIFSPVAGTIIVEYGTVKG